MGKFYNKDGRSILLAMVKAIQKNKDYLSEVDGLIGDGDHGANMNKGFTLYEEMLGEKETTLSEGLYDLGSILLNKIGGSMGPIYGTVFMGMSESLENTEEITLPVFADAVKAGQENLYDIIDARPGDKTLVDTITPAAQALREASENGKSFWEGLEDMKSAARLGMESTKDMTARYGRSARLGERSKGVLDAGSVSCNVILQAMADAVGILLE